MGCSPWGREESDTTERLRFHFPLSCTGEGNGSPLQCFCLENPRHGGAWWAAVYGVAESDLTEATQQQQQQQQQAAHVNAFLSLGPIQSFPLLCPHVRSPHVDKKLECSLKWARIPV